MNTKGSTTEMKSKQSASKKTKGAGKRAKFKSSKWYEEAARSLGITKESSRKYRADAVKSDPSDRVTPPRQGLRGNSRPVPLSLGSRRQVAARRSLAICTQQD